MVEQATRIKDFENLLGMPEHKGRALNDLESTEQLIAKHKKI